MPVINAAVMGQGMDKEGKCPPVQSVHLERGRVWEYRRHHSLLLLSDSSIDFFSFSIYNTLLTHIVFLLLQSLLLHLSLSQKLTETPKKRKRRKTRIDPRLRIKMIKKKLEGSQLERKSPLPTNQEKPPQPNLSQVIPLTFLMIRWAKANS